MSNNKKSHQSKSTSNPPISPQGETQQLQVQGQSQNLYKTELCRSFGETGTCRYGPKCQFAHGYDDLRSVVRPRKYKTEKCKNFATDGVCPYGPRCRFIHNEDKLEDSKSNSPNSTPKRSPFQSNDSIVEVLPPSSFSSLQRIQTPQKKSNRNYQTSLTPTRISVSENHIPSVMHSQSFSLHHTPSNNNKINVLSILRDRFNKIDLNSNQSSNEIGENIDIDNIDNVIDIDMINQLAHLKAQEKEYHSGNNNQYINNEIDENDRNSPLTHYPTDSIINTNNYRGDFGTPPNRPYNLAICEKRSLSACNVMSRSRTPQERITSRTPNERSRISYIGDVSTPLSESDMMEFSDNNAFPPKVRPRCTSSLSYYMDQQRQISPLRQTYSNSSDLIQNQNNANGGLNNELNNNFNEIDNSREHEMNKFNELPPRPITCTGHYAVPHQNNHNYNNYSTFNHKYPNGIGIPPLSFSSLQTRRKSNIERILPLSSRTSHTHQVNSTIETKQSNTNVVDTKKPIKKSPIQKSQMRQYSSSSSSLFRPYNKLNDLRSSITYKDKDPSADTDNSSDTDKPDTPQSTSRLAIFQSLVKVSPRS